MQRKLGARSAAAYDMFAACTGFVFGLGLARSVIGSGLADTVLVIGVETLSRIVDYKDRNTCVLFGDGAGAVVLRPCEPAARAARGRHAQRRRAGRRARDSRPAARCTRWTRRRVAASEHYIHMRGKELFKFAVRTMEESLRQALEQAGVAARSSKLLIPHQANLRIIDAVRERLVFRPSAWC